MNAKLHRLVRYAEIVLVGTLAVFGFVTYRELSLLRQVPVYLPSHAFEVSASPDVVVQTRGTCIRERPSRQGVVKFPQRSSAGRTDPTS